MSETVGFIGLGLVGLEYKPPGGDTEASLAWLPRERRGNHARA